MSDTTDLATYAMRLGDNALVLGQRLATWTGHGPSLEEDLASTNVALDLIGHARLWLAYAAQCEGRGRDADALAFTRDARAFTNVLLVERPNGDYAQTIVRQFFFDAWHLLVLRALCASRDARIAAIAEKAALEVTYHVKRSGDWMIRLGDGTDESHARMRVAIDDAWPYTAELFAMDAVDDAMVARGIGCDLAALHAPWRTYVETVLTDATLAFPTDGVMHGGGRAGVHTESFSYLLAEMQSVARNVPAERW